MSLYSKEGLPFTLNYDHRSIREVRRLRNLTLIEFSKKYMKLDLATVSKLENGQLQFSVHYMSKFHSALEALDVNHFELQTVKKIIEIKEKRGFYNVKQ